MSDTIIFPSYTIDPSQAGGGIQPRLDELDPEADVMGTYYTADPSDFVTANWLTRPELSNEEILLMSAAEVISLYYNVRSPQPPNADLPYRVDQTVCNFLPFPYAWSRAAGIQRQIYNLRTDLHFARHPNTGVTYPVLMNPSQLDYISGETTLSVAATVVGGVLTVAAPMFGLILQAIATAVQTGLNAAARSQALAAAAKATGIVKQVLYGVSVIQQLDVAAPSATPAMLTTLANKYQKWQWLVQGINSSKINQSALLVRRPERRLWTMYYPSVNGNPNFGSPIPRISWGKNQRNAPDLAIPKEWYSSNNYVTPHASSYMFHNLPPDLTVQKRAITWIKAQLARYSSAWTPYSQYFYSLTVANSVKATLSASARVTANRAPQIQTSASDYVPVFAPLAIHSLPPKAQQTADGMSVGLLALLLLL